MSELPTATLDGLIGVAAHVEAELDEALREQRLSRSSFLALQALAAAPDGALSQRALAAHLRRTAGTLSVRLRRLERAGLIARTPNPDDRRAARVEITDAGRSRLASAEPLYEERAKRLAEALPPPALSQLGEHVRTWLAFFEPSEDDAPRLGVAVAPSATANRMRRAVGLPDEPGILVMRVAPDGPAARAGLARGDLITAVSGKDVRTVADVSRAVRAGRKTVTLRALRGVEPIEMEIALG